jgi:hypothetical protein
MIAPRSAAPVVATFSLDVRTPEISEQAMTVLRNADRTYVSINALNASVLDFPPTTLAFLLRNADRIYGIADCCDMEPGHWEKVLDELTLPSVDDGRFVVRLLANDPAEWDEILELHGPRGPFCLTSPIYKGDTAAA